jgi:hypothetical protein
MFRQIIFNLLPAYPGMFSALLSTLNERPFSPLKAVGALVGIGWRSLAIIGCTVFLCRIIYRVLQQLKRSALWERLLVTRKFTEDHAA